jgi:hypothetical protein
VKVSWSVPKKRSRVVVIAAVTLFAPDV